MEIKYVTMPITKEQKKEFNKQGYRVIDAVFDPDPQKQEIEETPKAKRKTRAKKI